MLPLTLKLHNFLSYREDVPTLHLEDVHLACLCGANGHGKSALLDAITWAIWGKARSQRQEQLLHQGQQEMGVELEFEARGQRYRIIRRYSRVGTRGASSLELAVAVGDGYRAITGNSLRATEAYLESLLSMDYDTFVNSAFLMQGRADLFTMSTPSQRKEVLAKVLGLELYDRLEARARAHAREAQGRLQASEAVMQQLQERVARREEVADALSQTEAAVGSAQQAVAGLGERLALLRAHVDQLQQRRREAQELASQTERIEARRQEAEQEGVELERRLATWREATEGAAETEAGYESLASARQRLSVLQAAAQQLHALERELAPVEQRVAAARAALEAETLAQEQQLQEALGPRVEALPSLEQTIEQATTSLAGLEPQAAELTAVVARQHEASAAARRLEGDNRRIKEMGLDIRAKLDMLDDDGQPEDVRCPLCGTELGADARVHLEQAYKQEIDTHGQQYREQEERFKALDEAALRLQHEADRRQRELDATRQGLIDQRARAQGQRDEALRARSQMDQVRSLVAETRKALDEGRYAQEEQSTAAGLRQRIAALSFKPEDLGDAEGAVRSQERWETIHRRLEEARVRMPEDEAARERARARLEEATEELQRLQDLQAQISREVTELPGYQAQLGEVESEHREAARQRDELQTQRGSLAHQLEEVAQAARELRDRQREQQTLVKDASAYADLTQAFGKGGVQALLIEAAIPRLEEETNHLLRRMTNGRMSLKMETQRARRTGPSRGAAESIETLDILIADELGTRSYEMFSGGESFRVDFALRVALSKLLAWRAGAPLPTLFIDEGFGTQDTEGRDRILDVIKSIEPDFQRILVITHMDEVKEAFPVRIEVTKTPAGGSTFSVS